jgi:hypothetical protein
MQEPGRDQTRPFFMPCAPKCINGVALFERRAAPIRTLQATGSHIGRNSTAPRSNNLTTSSTIQRPCQAKSEDFSSIGLEAFPESSVDRLLSLPGRCRTLERGTSTTEVPSCSVEVVRRRSHRCPEGRGHRMIDGMDMRDFLLGDAEESGRDIILRLQENRLQAVKWHRWKAHRFTVEGSSVQAGRILLDLVAAEHAAHLQPGIGPT